MTHTQTHTGRDKRTHSDSLLLPPPPPPLPPQEVLNRSAWLLSGRCQRRRCVERLKRLPCSSALMDIPVFLRREGSTACWDVPPPLGLHGSQEHLTRALAFLPQVGLPESLRRDGGCRRCVVVGSGGVLRGSRLGLHIDQYDVIIRSVGN